MKNRMIATAAWHVLVTGAVLLIGIIPITSVSAQKAPPPPSQDRTRTYDANSELRTRDANITLMERTKTEAARRDAVQRQMNEDLERIQTLNASLVSAFAPGTPDYTRISEDSAELKKRAIRLKNNLALPPVSKEQKEEKQKSKVESDQLQTLVPELNELVKSFVANPLFNKGSSVDYQLLAKARRDLDGIQELGEKIRKAADKIGKAAAKGN